jgi:hypothetical protein
MAHFATCKKTSDASEVATFFFKEVVRLHCLSRIISSDKDMRFLGYFWRILWKSLGSKFLYSSSYHPPKNEHTKVVKLSLGNLLRSLSGKNCRQWDSILAQTEFAYNDLVNRSIGKIPFQIFYGRSPKGVVDLANLSDLGDKRSADSSDFVEIMQELHEQQKQELQEINNKYK